MGGLCHPWTSPPPRRSKLIRSLRGDACKPKKTFKKGTTIGKIYDVLEKGGGGLNDFKPKYTPLNQIKNLNCFFIWYFIIFLLDWEKR